MALQFVIIVLTLAAIAAGIVAFERNTRNMWEHKFFTLQAFLIVALIDAALAVIHQANAVLPGHIGEVRLIAFLCIVAIIAALGHANMKATNRTTGVIGTAIQIAVFLPATTMAVLAGLMLLSIAPVVIFFYLIYLVFKPRKRKPRRSGRETTIPA